MGDMRNVYRILVGKPEGKRPLGKLSRRWKDKIRIDRREGVDWMDRGQWRDLVHTVMNFRVQQKERNFLSE